MGASVQPVANEPTLNHRQLTPDQWQKILMQARQDLHTNREDAEAMQAIRDATAALNAYTQEGNGAGAKQPVFATMGQAARGIGQGLLDLPRGLAHMVAHPIQTAGQLTGIGNWKQSFQTITDPDSGWEERLDAVFRGLPTNIGYAPERALMDATGSGGVFTPERSSSPEENNVEDVARKSTNVASLALFGLGGRPKPATPRPGAPPTAPIPDPVGFEPPMPPRPPRHVDATVDQPPPASPGALPQPPLLLPPGPQVAEAGAQVLNNTGRVSGQKGITFGPESPLSQGARAEVKGLVGEITRNQPGPGSLEPLPNAPMGPTGQPYGMSAVGPETPPVPTGTPLWELARGASPMERLNQSRGLMDKHTPESIMGTDQLGLRQLPENAGEFGLGPNKGPDVPMGPEAGFLNSRMLDVPMIIFTPRLYLLLRRLNKTPGDVIGASRMNPQLSALIQDLSTASLLGQTDRIKDLEDQVAQALANGQPQR